MIIYFSTCSIYDNSLKESMYVQHKLFIEAYIKKNISRYIIYRLPIVVGNNKNPHTLTNFIFNSITNNQIINVHTNACRYLIDIEDVVELVEKTLFCENQIINLNFDNKLSILELIEIFENILKKKAIKKLIIKGSCYDIDNAQLRDLIKLTNYQADYNYKIIEKYYKMKEI